MWLNLPQYVLNILGYSAKPKQCGFLTVIRFIFVLREKGKIGKNGKGFPKEVET